MKTKERKGRTTQKFLRTALAFLLLGIISVVAMEGLTEVNKAHWDSHAKTYNDRNEKTIERLIEVIRSQVAWMGVDFLDEDEDIDGQVDGDARETRRKTVRMLDYACGPGMMSRALAPYVTQVQAIDLSDGMVSVYNTNAHNQGLLADEMSATVGNLLDPDILWPTEFKSEKWLNFDLAVVGHGFHHFEDPTLAATRLANRLRPGGVLMIMDFLPHDHFPISDGAAESSGSEVHGNGEGSYHAHAHEHEHGHSHSPSTTHKPAHIVAHFGFSEEDVRKCFEAAGVGVNFAFEVVAKGVVFAAENRKMTRNVFMARGTKGVNAKV